MMPVQIAQADDWRQTPWQPFTSELFADHRLAGIIWDPVGGKELTPEALVAALAQKRFVLVGEFHDNPDHHRLQAWIVSKLKPEAVVFEMLDVDQAAALDAFQAKGDWTPQAMGAALDWEKRGWPAWPAYQPIAEAAKEAGATLVAGNAERAKARAIVKGGLGSLDAADVKALGLDRPLPEAADEALRAEIAASHCDMLPEDLLPGMALAQRLRDATMARQLLKATGGGKRAVLITGNGHARRDRGVPHALIDQGAKASEIASVLLIEVDPEATVPSDLVVTDPDGKPAADYIWITPSVERPDPCEEMQRQMKTKSGG
jgi:uncharacterized iron-regulated protein